MSLIMRRLPGRGGREHADSSGSDSPDGLQPTEAANGSAAHLEVSQPPGERTERSGRDRAGSRQPIRLDIDIAPNDPILAYLQEASGPVDITKSSLESPALEDMRQAGVVLAVPLVVSGDLVGLVLLGPRLSERDYSGEDRRLLDSLASYAAPALRMGQLVEQQKTEALRRERIEQELVIAQLIQQQFLPKSLPDLHGWHLTAFYRPARTVGGDFYDCIDLPDGRAMIVVGDVTDKGVPAALVMASTHSLLRAAAPRLLSPGATLAQVNDMLCGDIPAHMFVTCIALVLDAKSGRIEYANAGHDLPYMRTAEGVVELRATGMPLGLMPAMSYEEQTTTLEPGDHILLHSDGLAEAHDEKREMFGFPRVAELAGRSARGQELIDLCLEELERFSGSGHEQEDDITLVTVECTSSGALEESRLGSAGGAEASEDTEESPHLRDGVEEITRFEVPSEPGNERIVMERVSEAVASLGLASEQIERLRTAVSETAMNGIEHGNANRPEVPVEVAVLKDAGEVVVAITDRGGAGERSEREMPDLTAKLAGLQSPRGWGLFLVENMVDAVDDTVEGDRHTVRLTIRLSLDDATERKGEGGWTTALK